MNGEPTSIGTPNTEAIDACTLATVGGPWGRIDGHSELPSLEGDCVLSISTLQLVPAVR